jgi:hypothetical protein
VTEERLAKEVELTRDFFSEPERIFTEEIDEGIEDLEKMLHGELDFGITEDFS